MTPSDPGSDAWPWQLLLLLALVLANAFFAMSEIAVITMSDAKLDRLAHEGNRRARMLKKLTANSSRFLSMIQIGVTLAGFLASSASVQNFAPPLLRMLEPHGPTRWHGLLAGVVTVGITVAIAYLSLVLGELVPKKIGMKFPMPISLNIASLLRLFSVVFYPLVWVVSSSANAVLRLFGIDPNAEDEHVTEEEIRMMVDVGGEKGVIEDTQKEMINNIFAFDDMNANDIMTHRTDIVGIEVQAPLADLLQMAIEEGVSRLPVFEGDIDSVIGIIYVKDLLRFVGNATPQESLRRLMRPALFVPESKRCSELFKEMTASHTQIAIVVDEYGGTAGLVTLEDALEAIVGNIQDEYDDEAAVARIDDNTFLLEGSTSIEEVEDLTQVALPTGEYETVAGFIISQLGFLPAPNEQPTVDYAGLRLTVESVEDRRIVRVRVEKQGEAKSSALPASANQERD